MAIHFSRSSSKYRNISNILIVKKSKIYLSVQSLTPPFIDYDDVNNQQRNSQPNYTNHL
jgi:hypothetical protein